MHAERRRPFIARFSVDFRRRDVLVKVDLVRSFADPREFQRQ